MSETSKGGSKWAVRCISLKFGGGEVCAELYVGKCPATGGIPSHELGGDHLSQECRREKKSKDGILRSSSLRRVERAGEQVKGWPVRKREWSPRTKMKKAFTECAHLYELLLRPSSKMWLSPGMRFGNMQMEWLG